MDKLSYTVCLLCCLFYTGAVNVYGFKRRVLVALSESRRPNRIKPPSHSHGSVSVVRTTFKVYGKMQTLTLSQPKTPEPIVTKF